MVGHWNRVYGPSGFVQWQFALPFGTEDTVRDIVGRLSTRAASFVNVLKTFGPGNQGHLSFPSGGWTLAVDIPSATAGLPALLDELDELVAEAGGRIYLAKDARLRPDLLAVMYPRLDEWRAVRDGIDPHHRINSDLARRLGL
jgi:decaprenylphospho-beta-D-ribofuranose 2-oxidase